MRRGAFRRWVVLPASLCLLVACDVQPSNPQRSVHAAPQPGDVVVSGKVLQANGTPLAGRPVYISRQVTAGDLGFDLLATVFTFGFALLSCATGDGALAACRENAFTTTTTAKGTWAERLRKADVHSGSDLRTMVFSTGARPAPGEVTGPAVTAGFYPDRRRIRLPAMRLWRPHLHADGDATTFRIRYDALPHDAGGVEVQLTAASRGLHLTDKDASRPEVLDARLLEDVTAQASVVARGQAGRFDLSWVGPSVNVVGTAGAPPSRGATCTTDVPIRGAASRACWLTDGQFGDALDYRLPARCRNLPLRLEPEQRPASRRGCRTPPVRTVTIDLGRPLLLGLVVLRATNSAQVGFLPPLAIEGSTDGSTWQSLGDAVEVDVDGTAQEVVPPQGLTARFVRLVGQEPVSGGLGALTEVSVWRGQPPVRPTAQPLILGQPPLQAPGSSGSDPWRLVAIVLAALLALVLAGVLISRRRRPGAN